MVIARIFGGLGNQLFIYAAARRLALKNNASLKLDVLSGFSRDFYQRSYMLDRFRIQASPAESFEIPSGRFRRWLLRKSARYHRFEKRAYICEEHKAFDPRVFNLTLRRSIYLEGYWQSEKYFKDIEEVLRKELTLTINLGSATVKLAKEVQKTHAVSLHARRYIEVPQAQPVRLLNGEYYQKAMERIAQQVSNPSFFCFSDSPEWLQSNISMKFPVTFVTHNAPDNDKVHEDLWLMSLCKHHIIANSTFSWWGAWLNPHPEKIVCAPCSKFWTNKDFIPEEWTVIE